MLTCVSAAQYVSLKLQALVYDILPLEEGVRKAMLGVWVLTCVSAAQYVSLSLFPAQGRGFRQQRLPRPHASSSLRHVVASDPSKTYR